MIKSLLDADENPPSDTKVIIEETTFNSPTSADTVADENVFTPEQIAEVEDILEIPSVSERAPLNVNAAPTLPRAEPVNAAVAADAFAPQSDDSERTEAQAETPLFQVAYEPESTAETARKSGLAYAAAITLFGAVVFMMIVGWGADLLFGSSPWGIVGGIVLGAVIGFVQFFRLSSQIFK